MRKELLREITPEDLEISATLTDLKSLMKMLSYLKKRGTRFSRILDLGCGYGGVTIIVGKFLEASEIYGVDIDEARLKKAAFRGIKTFKVDLNAEPLPFPEEFFDLVTSFGVLEHLVYYDNALSESYRVLRPGGYLLVSIPNLASWVNRLALLFGFQPRDVEVSSKVHFQGILPLYPEEEGILGHLHSATLRAMKSLLKAYGFKVVKVSSLSHEIRGVNPILTAIARLIDSIVSINPGLSRRFIILAQKPP